MFILSTVSRYLRIACIVFFFNDTATPEIYTYLHTLSLHDALPIFVRKIEGFLARSGMSERQFGIEVYGDHKLMKRLRSGAGVTLTVIEKAERLDRKSTRLNSSH